MLDGLYTDQSLAHTHAIPDASLKVETAQVVHLEGTMKCQG